jgi:hypothetical protein
MNLLVAYILDAYFRKQTELRKAAKEKGAADMSVDQRGTGRGAPAWRTKLLEVRKEMIEGEHVTVEDCMRY